MAPCAPDGGGQRVHGAPEVLGQAPLSCLAEEIDTPGEGQIKGLITIAGNPALSAPNRGAARRGAADARGHDQHRQLPERDSAARPRDPAGAVVPGAATLRRGAVGAAPLPAPWRGGRLRSSSPAIGRPSGRSSCASAPSWEGCPPTPSTSRRSTTSGSSPERLATASTGARSTREASGDPTRIVDLTLRMGPWGAGYGDDPDGLTLDRVQDLPHGLDLGPSSAPLDDVLRTTSGDIELAHDDILGDLDRLRARMNEPRPPLVLIGRRHVRSNNSWMHNLPALMRGRDRSTLLVHPDDAARRDLRDGEHATVASESGSVVATVEVSDEICRGVVEPPPRLRARPARHPFTGGERAPGAQHERAGPRTLRRRTFWQRRRQRRTRRGAARTRLTEPLRGSGGRRRRAAQLGMTPPAAIHRRMTSLASAGE